MVIIEKRCQYQFYALSLKTWFHPQLIAFNVIYSQDISMTANYPLELIRMFLPLELANVRSHLEDCWSLVGQFVVPARITCVENWEKYRMRDGYHVLLCTIMHYIWGAKIFNEFQGDDLCICKFNVLTCAWSSMAVRLGVDVSGIWLAEVVGRFTAVLLGEAESSMIISLSMASWRILIRQVEEGISNMYWVQQNMIDYAINHPTN